MEDIIIVKTKEPDLKDVIFIEGLPGVGNVGKLAAEHLIDELKAVKFADIYSKYFPPQVLVEDNGVVKLVNNELYFVKQNKKIKSFNAEFFMGILIDRNGIQTLNLARRTINPCE